MSTHKDLFDPEVFRKRGHWLVDRLAEYISTFSEGTGNVVQWRSPEDMLAAWPDRFGKEGAGKFEEIVERLIENSMHLHHPRFMGHQQGVALPMAALADLLASGLCNSNGVFEMGPAGTVIERRVIEWMGECLGFSRECDGVFTSGGTLGNLTALLAARSQKAASVWESGTTENLAILVSEHAHYSMDRAVRIMGWGEQGAIKIATDGNFRLDPTQLERGWKEALALGRKVIAVVASACNTATGTFDPIPPIADFCERHGLWLHVDGAHGASTVLSDKYRGLVAGIERADSVVWDAHKMLMMPALTTAVIFRKGHHSFETFSQKASYLFEKDAKQEWFNLCARTLETTKRNMALRLYIALHFHGTKALSDIVTSRYDLARELALLVKQSCDFELGAEPESNIVCFRMKGTDSTKIRRKLLSRGRFYIVQTGLPEGTFLRVSLMNPLTEHKDLVALLDEIRECAKAALS